MKNLLAVIVLSSLLGSCKDTTTEVSEPENLIPRDSLVMVLEDMMVMESHVQSKYPQMNMSRKVMKNSGNAILAKYGISFERYDKSVDYYASRQEEMIEIYTQVQDSLNWKMNKLQADK